MGRTLRYRSTTVYLEPRQVEALHRLSKQTKVPFAVYVREGIDLMLAKKTLRSEEVPNVPEDSVR